MMEIREAWKVLERPDGQKGNAAFAYTESHFHGRRRRKSRHAGRSSTLSHWDGVRVGWRARTGEKRHFTFGATSVFSFPLAAGGLRLHQVPLKCFCRFYGCSCSIRFDLTNLSEHRCVSCTEHKRWPFRVGMTANSTKERMDDVEIK